MELKQHHILVLLILVLAGILLFRWSDDGSELSFLSYSSTPEQPLKRTALHAPPHAASTASDDTTLQAIEGNSASRQRYSKTIKYAIRKLLTDSSFTELNGVLDNYLVATQKDIANERDLMTAYWAFELSDDGLADKLEAWVKASPDSYQPYLASAFYYYRSAWDARGGKWASETEQEQFAKMNEYFRKTASNLDTVMKLNNQALPAYYLSIGMVKSSGDIGVVSKVFTSSIKKFPDSYYLRQAYLWAARPRWGGSHELMQQIIAEAQTHSIKNPRLNLLNGAVYSDIANLRTIGQQYNLADDLYAKIIAYGDDEEAYRARGENNCRREHFQEALNDLNKAIQLYSEDGDYYYWRARAHAGVDNLKLAAEDISYAELLKPNDKSITKTRKWIAYKILDVGHQQHEKHALDEALITYNQGLAIDPDNQHLYYARSRVFAEKSDLDAAVKDLHTAIQIDPNDYDSVIMMDYVLTRRHDWDRIIAYWDDYIKRNPDDGRAYVERGGAYYRKGDIKAAVQDAKISADLGNPEGKAAYEKFGPMVK